MKNLEKLKIGTLFSAIGAPEFALKNLNIKHDIMFACDNDKNVKQTYLKNHKCDVFYDDVEEITSVPKTDLIVFGFPCQPFSMAGKGLGLLDKRGQLVIKAMNILEKSNPDNFIAENVEGLLTRDNGKTFKFLINKFKKMGYVISDFVLNSKDFGIPQNRKRVWIVGSKTNKISAPIPMDKTPPLSNFLNKHTTENVYASEEFLKKEKVIKKLQNYSNDYINCITRTISRNGSSSEYISYVAAINRAIGIARKPTVSECQRLFGFPNSFKFPDKISVTHKYNMFANSMVVPVVEKIIKEIYNGKHI